MERRALGSTELSVSRICLGTMTWGRQNTPEQAFEQLDAAVSAGVNFIDTAEIYPVPPDAADIGGTESLLGQWLAAHGSRQELVIATKVAGPGSGPPAIYVRDGATRFDAATIDAALDASLERLNTDYVDLLYLHWPARSCNFFGRLGYTPDGDEREFDLAETAAALRAVVASGRARSIGLSNETPWGVMSFIRELGDVPVTALQNPYSLLNRSFEVGLAEVCHRENIAMCGYSPLGFGVLAGKYLNGAQPSGSRLTLYPHYARYNTPTAEQAVSRYVTLASELGLPPEQLAIAWLLANPLLTSTIIGATSLSQLQSLLRSATISLPRAALESIDAIHQQFSNPCP